MAEADRLGVPLGLRNLQSCLAPELVRRSVDYYLEDFSVDLERRSRVPYAHAEYWRQGAPCHACADRGVCTGIYEDDLSRFGADAFRALAEDPALASPAPVPPDAPREAPAREDDAPAVGDAWEAGDGPEVDDAPAVGILRLAAAGHRRFLLLTEDPAGARPCLARAGGFGLSYEGTLSPPALRDTVVSLGQRFAAGPQDPGPLDRAVDLLRRAAGPGADLTEVRRLPRGRRLARWSPRRRHAPPATGPPSGPSIPRSWASWRGTRRLLKREVAPGDDADTETARLVARGLAVRAVDTGEAVVLLAAREAGEAAAAEDAERALGRGDDADAVRHLGEALGYPACCVAAIQDVGSHDDLTLRATCLPPAGTAPAPPRPSGSSPPWPWCPTSPAASTARPPRPWPIASSPPSTPTARASPTAGGPWPGASTWWTARAAPSPWPSSPGPSTAAGWWTPCTWPSTPRPRAGSAWCPGATSPAPGWRSRRRAWPSGGPAPSRPPSPPTTGGRSVPGPPRDGDEPSARLGPVDARRVVTNETCNQNCGFCIARRPTDDPVRFAGRAVATRVVAAARDGGEVVLTGGEPTRRRDLPSLVALARRAGARRVILETNAALVDDAPASALAGAGLDLAPIHLPATGAALDALTRDPGGFEATCRGARALADAGVALEAVAPLVADNAATLPGLPAALVDTGLPFGALLLHYPTTGARTRPPSSPPAGSPGSSAPSSRPPPGSASRCAWSAAWRARARRIPAPATAPGRTSPGPTSPATPSAASPSGRSCPRRRSRPSAAPSPGTAWR